MYLYHYTNIHDILSIVEKGMLFGSELDDDIDYGYGTGPINSVLERYRPKNLPDFIDRDKCIFFHPECEYNDFGNTEIKVNFKKLNQDKLYVADYDYAQQIWNDTVDYSFSGERSDIPLSESANKYWNSLQTLDNYLKNKDENKKVEVLYFGKIPFELIEITTTLHPLAQKIFGRMLEKYKVKRWSSIYGDIYITEKQHFKIDINPFTYKTSLYSKTGNIDSKAIEHFESHFHFSNKEVLKDGYGIHIKYFDIKEK